MIVRVAAAFLFLGVVGAVGVGRLVGGFSDADPNEDGVQEALNFAVTQHNLGSNDMFLRVHTGVVNVQKQIVTGINYVITVNMAKTNCRKHPPDEQCDTTVVDQPYQCKFTVWSRPWMGSLMMTEPALCSSPIEPRGNTSV
ncbi:cystatin C (amyloid angiopathy and cerebral hemorrhage) [Vanacampus margaritifer]